jgi:putative flippase GtrA
VIRHFLSAQFLRFLGVGITAALLHWLARIVLSQWMPFAWAVALAYGVGVLVAFLLNRAIVFPASTRPAGQQLRDFLLVNLGFFPVVWGASMAIESALRSLGVAVYTQALAHGIAIAIPMLATFLMYKFLAFREPDHGKP